MRCPECREVMRSFIDGKVDGRTRREVGLHLAECSDCARLIEDDHFWDEAIRGYLEHELPDGLRESILGDLAHVPSGAAGQGRQAGLDDLGWRKKLRIAWWAVRRDLSRPGDMLKVAALAAVLILAVNYLPFFRSGDQPAGEKAAFSQAGPIVQVGENVDWKPGDTVPTARLSLSGRLI